MKKLLSYSDRIDSVFENLLAAKRMIDEIAPEMHQRASRAMAADFVANLIVVSVRELLEGVGGSPRAMAGPEHDPLEVPFVLDAPRAKGRCACTMDEQIRRKIAELL